MFQWVIEFNELKEHACKYGSTFQDSLSVGEAAMVAYHSVLKPGKQAECVGAGAPVYLIVVFKYLTAKAHDGSAQRCIPYVKSPPKLRLSFVVNKGAFDSGESYPYGDVNGKCDLYGKNAKVDAIDSCKDVPESGIFIGRCGMVLVSLVSSGLVNGKLSDAAKKKKTMIDPSGQRKLPCGNSHASVDLLGDEVPKSNLHS